MAHGLRTLTGARGRFQPTLSAKKRHRRIARSDKRATHISALKVGRSKAHPVADRLPAPTEDPVENWPSRRSGRMTRECLAASMREKMLKILRTLANVRGIHVAPAYWHSDALLLADAKGSTQVTLSPMQPGKDLSELQDSFWHLAKLEGSRADFSGVIVEIGKGNVSFSTVSYFAMYPFDYNLSGVEFSPTSPHTASSDNNQSWSDQRIARLFSNALRKTSSYDFSQETLTFFGKDRKAIVVLNTLQQQGIENRRWRISKYRGDGSQRGDEDGLVDATESAEITLLHGRVEGSPGCGGWVGIYKVSGDRVTVQAGWVLAGFCYPAGFAEGRLAEAAFKGELRMETNGDHVLLRDGNGNARILLVPY
jgi:heat shock protein HslJ